MVQGPTFPSLTVSGRHVSESNLEPSPARKAIREPKSRGEWSWYDAPARCPEVPLLVGICSAHARMSDGYKT